jgi:hypothetical protein
MSDELDNEPIEPNDPFDDELDNALVAGAQLIAHIKRLGATELELPIVDDSGVWIVTVKRMGIQEDVDLK